MFSVTNKDGIIQFACPAIINFTTCSFSLCQFYFLLIISITSNFFPATQPKQTQGQNDNVKTLCDQLRL